MLTITPSGQACGASVTGIDLSQPLDADMVAGIRRAWLEHHVLAFPGQALSDSDLERITQYFGPFGEDPFIRPIDGHPHVIAVERRADETGPIFAEAWHSDWSFLPEPPNGTMLYGIKIPPVGGDTLFANQHLAWSALPEEEKRKWRDVVAVHSARRAYAPDGSYGKADAGRSMTIAPSDTAHATRRHRLVRQHAETGREGFFSCIGYIVGLVGEEGEATDKLIELLRWQTRDEFVYRHRWEPGMLVMWDNRSVLHQATGGYEGHHRLLHRTTIGVARA